MQQPAIRLVQLICTPRFSSRITAALTPTARDWLTIGKRPQVPIIVLANLQHRSKYSPEAFEAATRFCQSLDLSANILKPRSSRRARSSWVEAFVLFVSFVVGIDSTNQAFAPQTMTLPATLAERRHPPSPISSDSGDDGGNPRLVADVFEPLSMSTTKSTQTVDT